MNMKHDITFEEAHKHALKIITRLRENGFVAYQAVEHARGIQKSAPQLGLNVV